MRQKIKLATLARLSQMDEAELHNLIYRGALHLGSVDGPEVDHPNNVFKGAFRYSDALQIEVARQLSDEDGPALADAAKFCSHALGNGYVFQPKQMGVLYDHWFGAFRSRNTWGSEPRGTWPVTAFGAGEYWSAMHCSGPLHQCHAEISFWLAHDEAQYPDSDPARIFLVNVSAADRRLRKRAAQLGIAIVGNEFAEQDDG